MMMEIEKYIRYAPLAVGLKPSAMECKARLRGLERMMYSKTIMHLQETFSDVVKTDKTGLSKTAHTRWMISAFANFLPGSTIFRLA